MLESACGGVGAEIDDDGVSTPGRSMVMVWLAVRGKATGGGEDLKQAADAGDGDDGVGFAGDGDDLGRGLGDLDGDLGVAVHAGGLEAVGDEVLGLVEGETLDGDDCRSAGVARCRRG